LKGIKMALPSDTTTALQNQYDTANTNFSSGLTDLTNQQNATEASTLNDLNTKYNVSGLQNQITGFQNQILGLQKTLSDLPQNVIARDKGTLTNAAQLSRQTTAEGIPIQKNINDAGIAEAPLNTALTSANSAITQQMSLLNDQQARELSGYTTANQATLNGLLDKLTAQRTLDATDAANANALAMQENQYDLELRNANATATTKASSTTTMTAAQATADARSTLASLANQYKNMSWGDLQAAAKKAGFDPVYTRDYVYQQALQDYPQLSQSAIHSMVYGTYFPDGWR
jgi:hypothetical protein